MDGLTERMIACDADPWGEGAIRYPPEIARDGDRPMPRRNTIEIRTARNPEDLLTLVDCPQPGDPGYVDPREGIRLIVLPAGQTRAARITLDPYAVRKLRAALHRWEQGKDLAEPRN